MKRIFIIFVMVLFIVSLLPAQNASGKLTVWSFTDEIDNMAKKYFIPSHRGVQIEYSQKPSDQFQNWIDPVLYSDHGTPPDVFALEASFVRKYIESGLLLDITDIYNANKNKLVNYPVEVATFKGRVYGMSWQVCPGAFFYRRSLAKKYLGTDNPTQVQRNISNLDQFIKTAMLLKEKSDGKCVVISCLGDLVNPFLSMRTQPWIVGGKLVIDPAVEKCMDFIKDIHSNGLDGNVGQWSDEWFAGMNDELKDQSGNPVEVFGYFLPTWGLHFVLKTNAPKTSGDWAMVQGPVSYSWGGTWIVASAKTQNPNAAKEFIRYLTTDNGFLEAWAKDTGDVVSNTEVTNKIKNSYKEPYLGGQNHYAAFVDMAKNVNGKLLQGTDELILNLFNEALYAYVNGEKTKEQALADFRTKTIAGLSNDVLGRLILNEDEPSTVTNNTPMNNPNNTIVTNTSNEINRYLPIINEMRLDTDSSQGGKSTGKVSTNKEKIDGVEQTVINLSITLNKGVEYPWADLSIWGSILKGTKTASGIRFKVYGDGKPWFLRVITEETKADWATYRYQFDTIKNKVSIIDIPYSSLKQPEWGKQVIFNKNTIDGFMFSRSQEFGLGTSTIKIFDIEIY
jgi:ABC-type glycerol-3-phosphate transport system substrate-binding protein